MTPEELDAFEKWLTDDDQIKFDLVMDGEIEQVLRLIRALREAWSDRDYWMREYNNLKNGTFDSIP